MTGYSSNGSTYANATPLHDLTLAQLERRYNDIVAEVCDYLGVSGFDEPTAQTLGCGEQVAQMRALRAEARSREDGR